MHSTAPLAKCRVGESANDSEGDSEGASLLEESKAQGGRKVPPRLLAAGLLGKAIRKRWLRSSPQYRPARGKSQL